MAEEATGTEVQTAEVEATGTTVSESGRKRITGTIMSELQTELVANKFEESCIKAITDLMRGLMTVVDEAVAKNALKPELRGIQRRFSLYYLISKTRCSQRRCRQLQVAHKLRWTSSGHPAPRSNDCVLLISVRIMTAHRRMNRRSYATEFV